VRDPQGPIIAVPIDETRIAAKSVKRRETTDENGTKTAVRSRLS